MVIRLSGISLGGHTELYFIDDGVLTAALGYPNKILERTMLSYPRAVISFLWTIMLDLIKHIRLMNSSRIIELDNEVAGVFTGVKSN